MLDTNLPPEQKMTDYLDQVKNPCCFLCGNSAVHIKFDPEGGELKTRLKNFFTALKCDYKDCER
ncbi:DUF6870 family protein [Lacrimispora sp.]|uniref:DUF6870 family protein n=1 Tax=Lacrimispora sp. TaxID=2719234 RepID=UPI003460ED18